MSMSERKKTLIVLITFILAIGITLVINFMDNQKNEINFLTDRNQVLFENTLITNEELSFYRIETYTLKYLGIKCK